jgi:glucose-1-phosphate thymidylyltransferase
VGHIRRDPNGLPAAHNGLGAVEHKAQFACLHHADLLVDVMVQGHNGTLFYLQPGDGHVFRMDHLTAEKGSHYFFGNRGPVVMVHGNQYPDVYTMKGIVLAGGTGSRLFPLTKITNKHLLPIYDKPMIYYPIQTLADAGITDIMVVTGGRNSGDFLRLLANGKEFGLKHIAYTYQEGEGGIAEALGLCEHFADGQPICVVLGDNIVEKSIADAADAFRKQERGARILLKEVHDAGRFGVAEFDGERVVGIEEKPTEPKSNYAVTGIYMYDATVFDKIRTCKPSQRNELEITDVNNAYIQEGTMTYSFLDGWWTDAGTFDSLMRAANLVQAVQQSRAGQ